MVVGQLPKLQRDTPAFERRSSTMLLRCMPWATPALVAFTFAFVLRFRPLGWMACFKVRCGRVLLPEAHSTNSENHTLVLCAQF